MDNIIDNPRNTSNVNQQNPKEPHNPMRPQEFKFDVNSNSNEHDCNETKEHHQHGLQSRFVENIVVGSLVHEIEHFVGRDVAV